MTQDIPKNYDSAQVESRRYANWVAHGCFKADPARVSASRPAYSVVIPPPNVTGVLHMGHVLNNTIQDILVRRARLEGKEVLWLPGTDHAGIATQVMVEKQLKKTEGKTRRDLGREEFLKRVWDWKRASTSCWTPPAGRRCWTAAREPNPFSLLSAKLRKSAKPVKYPRPIL